MTEIALITPPPYHTPLLFATSANSFSQRLDEWDDLDRFFDLLRCQNRAIPKPAKTYPPLLFSLLKPTTQYGFDAPLEWLPKFLNPIAILVYPLPNWGFSTKKTHGATIVFS